MRPGTRGNAPGLAEYDCRRPCGQSAHSTVLGRIVGDAGNNDHTPKPRPRPTVAATDRMHGRVTGTDATFDRIAPHAPDQTVYTPTRTDDRPTGTDDTSTGSDDTP